MEGYNVEIAAGGRLAEVAGAIFSSSPPTSLHTVPHSNLLMKLPNCIHRRSNTCTLQYDTSPVRPRTRARRTGNVWAGCLKIQ